MNILYVFALVLTVSELVFSSPAQQCDGSNFEDLQDRITVTPCGKTICKLPKLQDTVVQFKFKTNATVNSLTNDVSAVIVGFSLPFIGLNGKSACANIYHEDGKTRAQCPLEANKEYIYTNSFYMEPFYPETHLKVVWSLNDGNTRVICFEMPAQIVHAKKKKN